MVLAGLQLKQIYDVDEADLYIRELRSQQRRGGQRLLSWYVAGRGHNHVWFDTLVVACPVPDPDALRAMLDRRVHIQILEMELFVGDDHVDVVFAAQAVVSH